MERAVYESLLLLEIGNTNVHYAWLPGGRLRSAGRIASGAGTKEGLKALLSSLGSSLTDATVLLSSVNRDCEKVVQEVLEQAKTRAPLVLNPLVIKSYSDKNEISVPNYHFLGGDLFCDLIGSARRNVLVVDAGTALKILALDKQGIFVGGAIAPGLELMRKALWNGTDMAHSGELFPPKETLALSTEGAVSSGIVYGSAAMIEGLVAKVRKEQDMEDAPLILTGGDSEILGAGLEHLGGAAFSTDPLLTLKGLALAFGRKALFA